MPPALYVLFEGPWLFSYDGTFVVATTFGDLPVHGSTIKHTCVVGSWNESNDTMTHCPGATGIEKLDYNEVWTGNLDPKSDKTEDHFNSVFRNAYMNISQPAVFVAGAKLSQTPFAGERTVKLPVPDEVVLAGERNQTTTLGPDGIANGTKPYVAAIFCYAEAAGQATGTTLTMHDGLKDRCNNDTAHHLIFRMKFTSDKSAHCETTQDQIDHIEASFFQLVQRIDPNPGLSIELTQLGTAKASPLPEIITPNELGLDEPKSAEPKNEGPVTFALTPATCAGGNIVLGN